LRNNLFAKIFFNAQSQVSFFDKFSGKDDRFDFFRGFITQNKSILQDDSYDVFKSSFIISYFEGKWL